MSSQNEGILNYLKTGQTLTPIKALNLGFGMRLGARIFEIRRQGYNVIDVGTENYSEYKLAEGISKSVRADSFQSQGTLLDVPTVAIISHV
jgi:hypothetical protein